MNVLIQYLIFFFVLVFIGNYSIHYYYITKQRVVRKDIENLNVFEILNVKLIQSWSTGIIYNKADLMLTNNQVVVCIYNSNFKGYIRQVQPILLLYKYPCQLIKSAGISFTQLICEIVENEKGIIFKTKMNSFFQTKDVSFKFELTKEEGYNFLRFFD